MDIFKPVYSQEIEASLKEEFKNILKDKVYLDHAGATLYSQQQIADVHTELSRSLFANPHSSGIVGKTTEDLIDAVRYQILDFFGTSPQDYTVIFTSGATAAIKLVAESFHYQNGRLVYFEENHTSILGMREYATKHTSLSRTQLIEIFERKQKECLSNGYLGKITEETNNLFVYPAQCNFSGAKYSLEWIQKTHDGYLSDLFKENETTNQNWYCLLDAASYSATNPLNLSEIKPDFVCLSFYKIFGYPTGLGALLVRNKSANVLKKRYFGGGTVFMALASKDVVVHRTNLQERFEDGTVPYLSIAALKHGFCTLKRHNLDMSLVKLHVVRLAQYVYQQLRTYTHFNNTPVCVLYHDSDFQDSESQGGIVNFNILRADGTYVGFAEVMHIANLYNISLRTGCFCNPGACQRYLGITSEDVEYYYKMGHVCGDQRDLIDGKPTGSVRISFGYMSTKGDADAILNMVHSCFLQKELLPKILNNSTVNGNQEKTNFNNSETRYGMLEKIYIYPIKSCAALEITNSWNLVSTGLQYDREWMIVNQDGVCLTQKHDTRMCLIQPRIDLQNNLLILTFDGLNDLVVDLEMKEDSYRCNSKVCGDKIQGWDCGDDVAMWLDAMLDKQGLRLVRKFHRHVRKQVQLSLVNQAQFLLINKASVEWLYERVPEICEDGTGKEALEKSIARFRPNFLIDFGQPFLENDFKEIYIGPNLFTVQGKCSRCQMICIDQSTGLKTVEPLRTLSRVLQGKIFFGIYLQMDAQNGEIAPAMKTTASLVSVPADS